MGVQGRETGGDEAPARARRRSSELRAVANREGHKIIAEFVGEGITGIGDAAFAA
jgi:hypothetical protein